RGRRSRGTLGVTPRASANAARGGSRDVLGVLGDDDPRVLSVLVDRVDRGRERRIAERAHGDRGDARPLLQAVEHRRAAGRAEVEATLAPVVADADVLRRPTGGGDVLVEEASLRSE